MAIRLIWCVVFAAICWYLVNNWAKWLRAPERPKRTPRNVLLLFGAASASLSLALAIGLFIHAQITGGFPFYHPTLMRVLRIGFLTALFGLLAALAGKGKPRISTAVCSVFCLLVWFMEAVAQ
jgi:hypothetical protein